MLNMLDKYGAEDVKQQEVGNKLRIIFKINTSEQALKCYNDFNQFPFLNQGEDNTKIYLMKSGKQAYSQYNKYNYMI